MAITRVKLSASTNGQGIALATGAPTTIHTSTTAANTSDEVHVWIVNETGSTSTVFLYVGTTGSSNKITQGMEYGLGLDLTIPGLFLTSGLILSANGGLVGFTAFGFVNRLTTGA